MSVLPPLIPFLSFSRSLALHAPRPLRSRPSSPADVDLVAHYCPFERRQYAVGMGVPDFLHVQHLAIVSPTYTFLALPFAIHYGTLLSHVSSIRHAPPLPPYRTFVLLPATIAPLQTPTLVSTLPAADNRTRQIAKQARHAHTTTAIRSAAVIAIASQYPPLRAPPAPL